MPDDATLFVIFHGSWSFLDTPNYVYVKAPEMGDEHVYRAGNWLGEHELPHGSYYRLTDGVGGNPTCCVDPKLHPVIKGAGIAGTKEHRGSHTTLLLAKPQQWLQLWQAQVPKGKLIITSGSIMCQKSNCASGEVHDPSKNPTTVSFFNVFEYSFDSSCPPKIDGMDWWTANPIPDYKGRGNVATLHFFAEHEDDMSTASHFSDAFRYGSLILGGDLSITQPDLDPVPSFPSLLDRRKFEFLPLSTRTRVLGDIGAGLATLNHDGVPKNDFLGSYWRKAVAGLRKGRGVSIKDAPAATCLPNAGDGGCP